MQYCYNIQLLCAIIPLRALTSACAEARSVESCGRQSLAQKDRDEVRNAIGLHANRQSVVCEVQYLLCMTYLLVLRLQGQYRINRNIIL